MKCSVMTRDRTMVIDEYLTIHEVKDYVSKMGYEFSLRRTLQFYGLKYVGDRAFTSKYRQEFNLSSTKTLYDIRLKELKQYKDDLIGHPVRGY